MSRDAHVIDGTATAGGGAHDVTGPDAAAHVDDATTLPHDMHDEAPLGPIDWAAWRAAMVGVAVGALVVVLLYVAIR